MYVFNICVDVAVVENVLLYKKLIYTGVTRAKRKLIIIGEEEAFKNGINNKMEEYRKTTLKEKLEKMYKEQ